MTIYTPGDPIPWTVGIGQEEGPVTAFRYRTVEARVHLDPALVYNDDATATDSDGALLDVTARLDGTDLVFTVTDADADYITLEFTTTARQGIDAVTRLAKDDDLGQLRVLAAHTTERPDEVFALPPVPAVGSYSMLVGPEDATSVGIFSWTGGVVGLTEDGGPRPDVEPGGGVVYYALGLVAPTNGEQSTVRVRIEESPEAPFSLSADLSDTQGIQVVGLEYEPMNADISREPGVVIVTAQIDAANPENESIGIGVSVPGAVPEDTTADSVVPRVDFSATNSGGNELLDLGYFLVEGSLTDGLNDTLAPLPIVRASGPTTTPATTTPPSTTAPTATTAPSSTTTTPTTPVEEQPYGMALRVAAEPAASGDENPDEQLFMNVATPGDVVNWRASIGIGYDTRPVRVSDARVRVHLPRQLRYNNDVHLVGAPAGAQVTTEIDDDDVVFTISGVDNYWVELEFTTTVREDIDQVTFIGNYFGSVTEHDVGTLDILAGRGGDDESEQIANLPTVDAMGYYGFLVGPTEAKSVGIVTGVGGVSGPEDENGNPSQQARPGDPVTYMGFAMPAAADGGGSTVTITLAESPEAPFELSANLSNTAGVQVTDSGGTPLPAQITRRPGEVTVTVETAAPSEENGGGQVVQVVVPGKVKPGTTADRIAPVVTISATNSVGVPLVFVNPYAIFGGGIEGLEDGVIPILIVRD